ncbi:UbiA prenyltransferase family [Xylaria bambusicola]|uniref:UbiA prenyltransferase family n=1 Tax=Xylaria bambusicola TaxID=326684 RepID=UPI002008A5B2|nr:UbiA prenyltransferase family [Xylaria bambusicola]KAI0505876.1 UbiA prenyltransferase family [Xylaria bambusicola]
MTQETAERQLASDSVKKPHQLVHRLLYHAYSIWLFTYSDLHTILFPETAFGVLHALWNDVLQRFPLVLYWVWINLLAIDIGNQRSPESIAEDKINKPWRTIPSGRWSPILASYGQKFAYVVALMSSWFIGGLRSCKLLTLLGFWYNDCGGSEGRPFTRNFINAMGITSFGLGALEVALGQTLHFTAATILDLNAPNLEQWILLLFVVILSTVHTQDMHDQDGDKVRGRNTMPLQIGDAPTRWITVGFMILWGVVCPLFWRCGVLGYATSTSIAYIVAFRTFFLRTVSEDRMTFALWNLWMVSLYTLPLEALAHNYIARYVSNTIR